MHPLDRKIRRGELVRTDARYHLPSCRYAEGSFVHEWRWPVGRSWNAVLITTGLHPDSMAQACRVCVVPWSVGQAAFNEEVTHVMDDIWDELPSEVQVMYDDRTHNGYPRWLRQVAEHVVRNARDRRSR